MQPQPATEEQRRVCDGCGKPNFLLYSIRTGEPANAVERLYCSLPCARLHSPGFTGRQAGR